MTSVIVFSSNGEFIIDQNGVILSSTIHSKGFGLESIASFDTAEWKNYYGKEELPTRVDILDLGYTNKDGSTELPEVDWRKEFRDNKL